MRVVQNRNFRNIEAEWRLEQDVSSWQSNPIISDDLVPALDARLVASVNGLRRIVNGSTVELSDGTRLEVDSIIFCTGYKLDFSLAGECDPTRHTTEQWPKAAFNNQKPLPRLYQNIFPLDYRTLWYSWGPCAL